MDVAAPPGLVFQMLAAIGQGAQSDGERAEIRSREGDTIVADFWTRVAVPLSGPRSVRTRERVRVVAPDRIEYEHLDGPVRGLRERIVVEPVAPGCRVSYEGTYPGRGVLDRLMFRLVSRRALERAVRDHLHRMKLRAEDRARRSRVFRTP